MIEAQSVIERPLSPDGISKATGGAVSAAAVREFCRRGEAFHPLPHVRVGAKRPAYLIRPSVFAAWWAEEESITCQR